MSEFVWSEEDTSIWWDIFLPDAIRFMRYNCMK